MRQKTKSRIHLVGTEMVQKTTYLIRNPLLTSCVTEQIKSQLPCCYLIHKMEYVTWQFSGLLHKSLRQVLTSTREWYKNAGDTRTIQIAWVLVPTLLHHQHLDEVLFFKFNSDSILHSEERCQLYLLFHICCKKITQKILFKSCEALQIL